MKKSFTLAEVLITLGIIGIVAAMTLPTVINKNQERVTVAKVKKFYSVMNQALLRAINDNGYVDEWDFYEKDEDNNVRSDKFANYIKPYLNVTRDCGIDSSCLASDSVYKLLNGNRNNISYSSRNYYKMILNDGSYLWIRNNNVVGSTTACANSDSVTPNVCGLMWIDINGPQKPNTIGEDTFVFFIMKDRIIPHTKDDCYAGGTGWGCAAYILKNDNMKYLYK